MSLNTRTIVTFLFVEETFANFCVSFQRPTNYNSLENGIKEFSPPIQNEIEKKKNVHY